MLENLTNALDIEKTLLRIDEVATNQDDLVAEETLILRGQVISAVASQCYLTEM